MSELPAALESPRRLREHLHAAAGNGSPFGPIGDQGTQKLERNFKPAAVLIAIVERPAGLQLILTQRAAHLKAHAGQISFPGGRMEPEDANAASTALREANEEIGLPLENVEVLGGLHHYDTVTGFRVYPIVGWLANPVEYVIDPAEVEEVFEVPLVFLIDHNNHRRDYRLRDGQRRHFFAIPYGKRYIWGATAGMLVGFAKLLHSNFRNESQPETS